MIDLHTHSTASDGTVLPETLLECAAAAGLCGLALTDHDTLAGLDQARERARALGVRFLGGVELSACAANADDVHLLGYRVDGGASGGLRDACYRLRMMRLERARAIVERLNRAGVGLTWDLVTAVGIDESRDQALGRPHIAQALVTGGWNTDIKDAFRQWLIPGRPGFVPKPRLDAVQAIDLVRSAGGAAVLAHPGTLPLALNGLEQLVAHLGKQGLAGIEAYWPKHTPQMVAHCERLAERYHLLLTGGSDYHGANKPDSQLGMLAGGRTLPTALMDEIEDRASKPCSSSLHNRTP